MHEIIESFITYVRKKGYVVHENANPNTGKGTITWISEKEKKAGSLPVSYFTKYVEDEQKIELEELFQTFTQRF